MLRFALGDYLLQINKGNDIADYFLKIIFKELWGLILSQGQLAKGP